MKRKQWISEQDIEYRKQTQTPEISWSSSDSEDIRKSPVRSTTKRPKANACEIPKEPRWISEAGVDSTTNEIDTRAAELTSTPPNSPVIGSLNLGENSPILGTPKSPNATSPIIGKRRLFKRKLLEKRDERLLYPGTSGHTANNVKTHTKKWIDIQVKRLTSRAFEEEETITCSPNLFSTQISIESIPSTPRTPEKYTIDLVSTQEQSDVVISSVVSTENTGTSSVSDVNVWQKLSPKKKKRYKKDGLAYKLQSALKKQKAELAIWKHELFLARNTGDVSKAPGEDSVRLLVNGITEKFGSTILECDEQNDSGEFLRKCFVIIGSNVVSNVRFKIDKTVLLFRPFSVDTFLVNSRNTVFYLNAFKFMTFRHKDKSDKLKCT